MCGIAGHVSFDGAPSKRDIAKAMAETLAHRGPDDSGFSASEQAALAFRRLSIIDLDGGRQPLFNEDRSLALVLNGEIYNYVELQSELRERGHRLSSRSDAEVVLHLYEESGEACLQRLRGMFAFALLDMRQRRILLVRDRIGIKPLYYAALPDGLRFGSEMKAILADPDVPRDIDPGFLDDYLSFGYGLHPSTVYRSIRILPAAHYLIADSGKPDSVRIRRYWAPPEEQDDTRDERAYAEALRETLTRSVEIHMRSDVPYGAFLSGGLDSSTVVALMAQRSPGPFKTFSIGFPEEEVSELPYAREIAAKYGTDHKERIVEPADVGIVERLVHQFDEPFADCSALPTFFVSKIAREDLKVVLSGDGGDELFGGYNKYTRTLGLAHWDRVPRALRRHAAGALARRWPRALRGRGWLSRVSLDPDARFLQDGIFFDEQDKREMLQPDAYERMAKQRGGSNPFLAYLESRPALDPLTRFQLGDLNYYLVDDILQKVDRCSMAHSLEVRVPLLDHEVVELAFRMPPSMKIRNGTKKYILRRTFGPLLTPRVLRHRKQGFFAPIDQWFRGELFDHARQRLLSRDSATRDFLRPRWVESLLRAHRRGLRNLSERIWCLLMLEEWGRRNPL